MQHNDDLKRGEVVASGDDLLIVEQTPTAGDESYVVSTFETPDDLVDDETGYAGDDVDTGAASGVRSMGGAVGTEHRRPEPDR